MTKFSIRDLFAMVTIVALALGWWADHRRLVARLGTTGEVTGSVTVNGHPLAAGTVVFYLSDGRLLGSKLKNGNFQMSRVPVGSCAVDIQGASLPRFESKDTRTLEVNVMEGTNELRFELAR